MGKRFLLIFSIICFISFASSLPIPNLDKEFQNKNNITYNVNYTAGATITNNYVVNSFDQSLNTTDNVIFNNITSSGLITFLRGLFVPYTGATQNVDLGLFNLTTSGQLNASSLSAENFIDFVGQTSNVPAPPSGTARLHSLQFHGFTRLEEDNEAPTNIILGRDNVFIAKNTLATTILEGQAVYVNGATGNVPNIGLALANQTSTLPAVGIALDNINAGAFGQVMKLGVINNFDTSSFSVGDNLWVSTTNAGNFTNVRPTYPNYVQRMGIVLISGIGNGAVLVVTAPFVGGMESGTNNNNYTFIGNATAVNFIGSGQFLTNVPENSWLGNGLNITNSTNGIKVGVGTSSPRAVLDLVTSTTSIPFILQSSNGFGYSGMNFYDNGSNLAASVVYANPGAGVFPNTLWIANRGTSGGNDIVFATNNVAERMRILRSGYIGINTSTPTSTLSITSSNNINSGTNLANGIGALVIRDPVGTANLLIDSNQIEQINSSNALYLNFNSSAQTIINYGGGNVGIGTINPGYPLEVMNGIALNRTGFAPYVLFARDGTIIGQIRGISKYAIGFTEPGGANNYFVVNTSTGNVGIGTINPQAPLEIVGIGNAVLRLTDGIDGGYSTFTQNNAGTANQLDINLFTNSTDNQNIRIFRSTNTTGQRNIQLFAGNGTANLESQISMGSGDTYFNRFGGSFGIGTNVPVGALYVSGQNASFISGTTEQWVDIGRNSAEKVQFNIQDGIGKMTYIQDADAVTDLHDFYFDGDIAAGGNLINWHFQSEGGDILVMNGTSDFVGINISNPQNTLNIRGSLNVSNESGDTAFRITPDGAVVIGPYTTSVNPAGSHSLYIFDWINKSAGTSGGMNYFQFTGTSPSAGVGETLTGSFLTVDNINSAVPNLTIMAGNSGNKANSQVAIAYSTGSTYKSAFRIKNVASGYGNLSLMETGGNLTIGANITRFRDIGTESPPCGVYGNHTIVSNRTGWYACAVGGSWVKFA